MATPPLTRSWLEKKTKTTLNNKGWIVIKIVVFKSFPLMHRSTQEGSWYSYCSLNAFSLRWIASYQSPFVSWAGLKKSSPSRYVSRSPRANLLLEAYSSSWGVGEVRRLPIPSAEKCLLGNCPTDLNRGRDEVRPSFYFPALGDLN